MALLGLQIFVYLDFQCRKRSLSVFKNNLNLCFRNESLIGLEGKCKRTHSSLPGKAEPKTLEVSHSVCHSEQIICSVTSFSSVPDYLQLSCLLQPDSTGEDKSISRCPEPPGDCRLYWGKEREREVWTQEHVFSRWGWKWKPPGLNSHMTCPMKRPLALRAAMLDGEFAAFP